MSSYKEFLAQREQLDKQIKEAIAREKADGNPLPLNSPLYRPCGK